MSSHFLTFAEIGALAGAAMPDGVTQEILERRIEQVSASRAAGPTSLVFAEDEASFAAALASGAGAILTNRKTSETEDDRVLRTADPRYAFALCGAKLRERAGEDGAPQIHASASVDGTAKLGRRVRVDAGAVVEAGVVLGDDVQIGSNAVVREGAVLGNRVVVQAGAVLGSLGFGYVRHAQTGEYLLFPQQGELVIEDDVEIGANTTIDRGALEETRIGRGTKIDNLVHIGHNCRIGKHVVIAAQVGISGSCVVEDGAILAGQVGISDHCQIGPGVILGGQAGVYRGKSVEGPGEVFSGTPAEPLREHMKSLARLRRLR